MDHYPDVLMTALRLDGGSVHVTAETYQQDLDAAYDAGWRAMFWLAIQANIVLAIGVVAFFRLAVR